jgi:hypothetical protein
MPPAEDDDDDSRVETDQALCEDTTLSTPPEVSPHAMRSLSRLKRMPVEPLYRTLGILLI